MFVYIGMFIVNFKVLPLGNFRRKLLLGLLLLLLGL